MSFVLRVVPENLFHLTTQHGPGHGGTARRSVISGVEIALLAEPKIGQGDFFFSFFSSDVEISTEFSTSAAKKKKRYEFRAILRFLIVENRVEIALYANPTPFAGWKGQTRKGANSSPNANANATGIPSKRARKSPTREREREKRTRRPCPPSPSSWCESPKKGGKKKPRDTSQHNQSPDPRFPSSLLDTARNTGRSPRW